MSELIKIKTYNGDSWWYLVSEDGVLSRWPTLDAARLEFHIITGKDWIDE